MNKFLLLFTAAVVLATSSSCIPDPISPEERLASDVKKIEKYLDEKGLTAQSTSTGLHYIIEQEGTGGHPDIDDEVTVHYKGYLLNGNVFDETGASPATFPLRSLILGWQEGIPFLQKGGKGKFLLPSKLGYGSSSPSADIPSHSVLVFDIELVDF